MKSYTETSGKDGRPGAPPPLERLCVHTITTKPWGLDEVAAHYRREGVHGVTVWRDTLGDRTPAEAGRLLRDAGLEVVSYCRGGFFPHREEAGRQAAIDDNRRVIEEAAALGAPLVVLVCGAVPGLPLATSRQQIAEGVEAVLPEAESAGVKLALEPLHPMYADDRSALNTLAQANDLAEAVASPWLGVAADVYHLWWDPALREEIARCGHGGHLHAFHVCDWKTPTEDLLLDRGLMGEGCIDIPLIRSWVEGAGFGGFIEVEIFSKRYWEGDQLEFLRRVVAAYESHV